MDKEIEEMVDDANLIETYNDDNAEKFRDLVVPAADENPDKIEVFDNGIIVVDGKDHAILDHELAMEMLVSLLGKLEVYGSFIDKAFDGEEDNESESYIR